MEDGGKTVDLFDNNRINETGNRHFIRGGVFYFLGKNLVLCNSSVANVRSTLFLPKMKLNDGEFLAKNKRTPLRFIRQSWNTINCDSCLRKP